MYLCEHLICYTLLFLCLQKLEDLADRLLGGLYILLEVNDGGGMLNFDLIDDSALLVSELGDLITDVRKLVVEVCLANGYLRSQI